MLHFDPSTPPSSLQLHRSLTALDSRRRPAKFILKRTLYAGGQLLAKGVLETYNAHHEAQSTPLPRLFWYRLAVR
jgi:hypothetical protein